MDFSMPPRAGDWVQIKSKEEILRSLDTDGRLDDLPFMPQMFDYCGQRFRVVKRAHKTCDTVNRTGGRSLPSSVHLANLRCDGKAYGGCQASCLLFWKEDWLEPLDENGTRSGDASPEPLASQQACSEEVVRARTLAHDQPATGGPKYSCQATALPEFTKPLPWWNVTQYAEDYSSGNASLRQLVSGLVYALYYPLSRPGRRNPIGPPFRWLYDRVASLLGGVPFPRRSGLIPLGQPTPQTNLNLQPGEWVRIKSYSEILASIDRNNKNKGLFFDAEMVPFCGKTFQVRTRVARFIGEDTGLMVNLRTPAVILENVWCQSRYSDRRMLCPRAIYSWWREEWLERITPQQAQVSVAAAQPFADSSTDAA
jgi:hypothetical protein